MSNDFPDHAALVEWLQSLPPDVVVAWSDDGEQEGLVPVFADIYIPMACDDLGWNWVWTIVGDEDDTALGGDDYTTFYLPYDAVLVESDPEGSVSYPAWRVETISDALQGWAETFAGREDITFEFSPLIGLSPAALAALSGRSEEEEND